MRLTLYIWAAAFGLNVGLFVADRKPLYAGLACWSIGGLMATAAVAICEAIRERREIKFH